MSLFLNPLTQLKPNLLSKQLQASKMINLTLSAHQIHEKQPFINQALEQIHFVKAYQKLLAKPHQSPFQSNPTLQILGYFGSFQDQSLITKQLQTAEIKMQESPPIKVLWFPIKLSDIDSIGKTIYQDQVLYSQDHPQFTDPIYRQRRNQIASIAHTYTIQNPIPIVDYTLDQHALWAHILKKLTPLHQKHFSQRLLHNFHALNNNFNIKQRIPQLSQLSAYLHGQTGFRIKPVHGIVRQRQFLNALALKVFLRTQFLRHPSTPEYTPEPDIVHEIVGHVLMFADKDIADLSQKIGEISLGASDEQIKKLGTLYFLTVQFGVYKQKGSNKIYGAGFASCVKQIQKFASQKAQFNNLQPEKDCTNKITTLDLQRVYYVTQSFKSGLQQIKQYGSKVSKPFETLYNPLIGQVNLNWNIQRY